jgi:hypothetical protein
MRVVEKLDWKGLILYTALNSNTAVSASQIYAAIFSILMTTRDICRWQFLYTTLHEGPEELSWYSDWLRAGHSGDPIPVGARFFAHVQTGPVVHPAYCTMATGSFPEVKWPRRGADHPPTSSTEVKKD